MKQITLDGNILADAEKIHDYLKKALDLPAHYGNNLDALFDILTEFTFPKIVFINYKNFEKKVPNFVRKLKTLNENLISEGSSNIIEFM